MRAHHRAAQAEALHPHRGGKNEGGRAARKGDPSASENPPKPWPVPTAPTRDELGQFASTVVARTGSVTVSFALLLAADLGYPYEELDIVRWWNRPVLDAWLDRWGMHMLPVKPGDVYAVLVPL